MLSFFRNLLSPAGGLSYHMTAWKQARSTWNPFRQRLSLCLENWEIKNDHLLLIGASGGYTLTDSFLQNFQKITCIDPDPLAPFFFRHRFSNDNIHWDRRDYFSKPLSTKNSHHFETLLTHYPNSSILFCNILGQLPLLYPQAMSQRLLSLASRPLSIPQLPANFLGHLPRSLFNSTPSP